MSAALVQVATGVVRVWARLYTWGLSESERERRRREIDSDLWELAHDTEYASGLARHILARLLAGIPDDLRWRMETEAPRTSWVVAAGAVTFVALATWVLVASQPGTLPVPPAPPKFAQRVFPPPPPPPPPPPEYVPARDARVLMSDSPVSR